MMHIFIDGLIMKNQAFISLLTKKKFTKPSTGHNLNDGSQVAVIGGGPAGSLFAYFLLNMAELSDLELYVDIYEPRDFALPGPPGCNMCAGIVSESLIQMLALDGINLPAKVVQRGMDSYVLHNDAGKVFLNTPAFEKRIGTVFRGAGPKNIEDSEWTSFDGYLLKQATDKGANLIQKRVCGIERVDGGLRLKCDSEPSKKYDFTAVATGVNTNAFRMFEPLGNGYKPPQMTKTHIREYYLGKDKVQKTFGQTIHFFLLPMPGLDYAAVVPKGSYVTICMLGKNPDHKLFETFLNSSQVKDCMPPDWKASDYVCQCSPRINLTGAVHPFADRMVFLGDCGISRLYKDGIGAAYRAAKAAASAAIFYGIGEEELKRYYGNSSLLMENDNRYGKLIFSVVDLIKPWNFTARAFVRMVESEQTKQVSSRRMSNIMWDIFTGSAPYKDIAIRMLHPSFWLRLSWHLGSSITEKH